MFVARGGILLERNAFAKKASRSNKVLLKQVQENQQLDKVNMLLEAAMYENIFDTNNSNNQLPISHISPYDTIALPPR